MTTHELNPSEPATLPHSTDEVARWLSERIASYSDRPGEPVDPDVPLAELGLDSVYVLGLCGDIEDTWGLGVDPTVAWDHPTVSQLAKHLFTLLHETRDGA